ncbi:MAG: hypothetical protein MZW92_56435 [Comamonadaceae bacterium]|nr:hypothetical protein [Comamonadaceae bacterium]
MKGGRCEACEGDGVKRVEMHFLPDVYVPCEVCHGRRFNEATLRGQVQRPLGGRRPRPHRGRGAAALQEPPEPPPRRSRRSADVGLGYIALGQSSPDPLRRRGAARQALARAARSARPAARSTSSTSPRPASTSTTSRSCSRVLDRLVEAGNTVVVIEHNLDVIKTADWVIDLGPEGGDGGGRVVAEGTPEQVARGEGELHRPLPRPDAHEGRRPPARPDRRPELG